jgi:hypothetical protein
VRFEKDQIKDSLMKIKIETTNPHVKTGVNIVPQLLTHTTSIHHKHGEATLIINNVRPYIENCLIYKLSDTKFEWQREKQISTNNPVNMCWSYYYSIKKTYVCHFCFLLFVIYHPII